MARSREGLARVYEDRGMLSAIDPSAGSFVTPRGNPLAAFVALVVSVISLRCCTEVFALLGMYNKQYMHLPGRPYTVIFLLHFFL